MSATLYKFPTPPQACKDAELALSKDVLSMLQTAESLFNAGHTEESRELLDFCICLAKFAYDLTDERYAPDSDVDSINEYLMERINEQEIIYYSNAIDYLKDNDPSLTNSIALATEYDFELKNLDSEKLATILYQQNLNNESYSLAEKLSAIFEEHRREE